MGKVAWSQRVLPEDKEFLDDVLEAYQRDKGLDSKGDALVHFVRNRAGMMSGDSETIYPEILYPRDTEFEAICPFGFLKQLVDKKGSEKWHCLKQQGPDKKGKPVLVADGKDRQSIKAICDTCQINWQRGPSQLDQIRMIFQELGDRKVASMLYFCIRDAAGEGVKLGISEHSRFYCTERSRKVTVKKTCVATGCPYLVQQTVSLSLGETLPFMEARKVLEVL